jgi:hypothetical protein
MNPIDRNILPLEELKEYRLYRNDETKIFRIGDETFYSILEKYVELPGEYWKVKFESREHARLLWKIHCENGWKPVEEC